MTLNGLAASLPAQTVVNCPGKTNKHITATACLPWHMTHGTNCQGCILSVIIRKMRNFFVESIPEETAIFDNFQAGTNCKDADDKTIGLGQAGGPADPRRDLGCLHPLHPLHTMPAVRTVISNLSSRLSFITTNKCFNDTLNWRYSYKFRDLMNKIPWSAQICAVCDACVCGVMRPGTGTGPAATIWHQITSAPCHLLLSPVRKYGFINVNLDSWVKGWR